MADEPLEPLKKGVKLIVRERICNNTKLFIVNPQFIGYQIAVHNSCTCNEIVALRNRHLLDRTLDIYDETYMLNKFKNVSRNWHESVRPMKYQDVVNCYKGSKKRMYQFAMLEVRKFGIRNTDHHVRMFVKYDKYCKAEIGDKMPRAIQYRQARYNLVLASYLKPFEEKFYKQTSDRGHRIITKGLNYTEMAKLLLDKTAEFQAPIFLSCDHSKFDSTINKQHLKFEHNIYNRSYKSTELKLLLRKQLFNKGFSRCGVQYRVEGTRMSGDYNTGLGNSLINRAILESWLVGIKHEIMLDGDDSVVIIEGRDRSRLDFEHFGKCGFTTEINISDKLEDVEYCRRKLCNSSPPVLVRNPVRALSNLAATTYNYGALGFKPWAMGALECERLGNPGIPIFSNLPKASKIIKDVEYHRKLEIYQESVDCSVIALSKTWNISIDVIRMLHDKVKNYSGWDCDNKIKNTIKVLKGQTRITKEIKDASSTITAQQSAISQQFNTLCPSASQCWREIGETTLGTTDNQVTSCQPGKSTAFG
jgi:hypothetical protein